MIAWLVYSVALSALAGLAGRAGEALLALYRRPTRWAWAATIVVSCAGPLVLAARRPTGDTMVAAPVVARRLSPASAVRAAATGGRVEAMLPAAWGASSVLLLAGIAAGLLSLRRRRRGWSAGMLAGHPVLVSGELGPAVVGIARPAIVVPGWTLAWPEPMQRLVVRHEGEHIRARDPLLVLGAAVAAALVPWNLAVWWQLRRLRLAVEVDCDARTLRAGGDVATYGDLLLRVGARGSGVALPVAAFAEPRSFLERRIRAMTHRTPRNRAARAAACAALTLGVAASGYALPAPELPELGAPIRALAVVTPAARDTAPVLDISEAEVMPKLVNAAEVARAIQRAYPTYQRNAGIGGTVLMEMVVRENGTATNAVAVSGHPDFSVVALELIPTLRFSPGQRGGRPVAVRLQLPIAFTSTAPGATQTPPRDKESVSVVVDTVRLAAAARTAFSASSIARASSTSVDTVPAASAITIPGPARAPGAAATARSITSDGLPAAAGSPAPATATTIPKRP